MWNFFCGGDVELESSFFSGIIDFKIVVVDVDGDECFCLIDDDWFIIW